MEPIHEKYRAEMASPGNRATLDLLAPLSHQTDFSVGCYCRDESHCTSLGPARAAPGAGRQDDVKSFLQRQVPPNLRTGSCATG